RKRRGNTAFTRVARWRLGLAFSVPVTSRNMGVHRRNQLRPATNGGSAGSTDLLLRGAWDATKSDRMAEWQLAKNSSLPNIEGPVIVCVMDGVGNGIEDESNAVWLARTPNLDWLAANCPTTELAAHGVAVGMP